MQLGGRHAQSANGGQTLGRVCAVQHVRQA